MKITVNGIDISNRLLDYKIAAEMNSDSLLFGNAVAKQITMKLDNQDGSLNTLLDYPFIIQNDGINKTGTFYVYEKPEKYTGELFLILYDNMYLFSQRYDTKLEYPTTIEDQIDEMALITGVSINKTNLRAETLQKTVDWYDNTVSMRNYLGWIAELDGCNAFADPNGNIIFRDLATSTYSTVDVETYEKGDLVKFTRVCYDDGLLKLESGTDTGNTLYLSSNNGYIDSDVSLDYILNKYTTLQFCAVKNVKMANINSWYLTDLINYNDEFIFMPLSISEIYSGGQYSIASVSGEVNTTNNEMVVNKVDMSVKIKRIQTIVDKNNQTLKTLAQDLKDGLGKVSEFEQTLDGFKQSVSKTEEKIEEIELKPTIKINPNFGTQQVYSPSTDTYIPDWRTQPLTLIPEIYVMDKLQTLDASKIAWTKKNGTLGANETVSDGILTINQNVLSEAKIATYQVVYNYAEGKSVSTELSFSLVKDGTEPADGKDAATCLIVPSGTSFTSSDGITYTPDKITLTPQFQGCGFDMWQYSSDGITWNNIVSGQYGFTIKADKTLTISNTTPLLTDTNKCLNIKLLSNQLNVVSVVTITKIKDGQKGDKGDTGVSITKVEVEYYLSTSNTTQTGGSWSTSIPAWADGKYIWSRTKTTLSNGTATTTNPVCITGGKGATGATGQGIASITTEFYLSTSKTTQTGGSWVTTMPVWENGKYVWTRSKIVYNNPTSTEYTTPVCDTGWEAANDVKNDLDAKITTNTKSISDLQIKSGSIETTVSTINETLIQTSNGLSSLTETYNSFVEQNDQRFSLVLQQSKEYTDGMTANANEVAKYFNITKDGLELSAYDSDNPDVSRIKSLQAYDHFAIKYDDSEVMKIYKDEMRIDNINLGNSLKLKPWIVSSYGSGDDGGWVFRWGGF